MTWLTLLLAFQQGLWIDVPFIEQDRNGCGSASIWMVMEHWKPGSAPRVEEIQQQLYSREAGGIFAKDMARYFEAHGYRVFAFRGEWPDLEQHVSKGRPLIVSLERNARGVPLHYVVVAGIDAVQNLVLVNDPAQRKLLSISRPDFEQSWRATDYWTLLALPEIDLAGKAFRDENLSEAREHLTSALRVNPEDAYANDFLATVYFLQNNHEAAVKYWNRVGKPEIEDIRIDPPLQLDPILLDRAFTFSRGSTLKLADLETTRARLDALHVFSRYQIELSPAAGERFDVKLRAAERNGANFVSWFRGLPFRAVNPEFSNIGGKAINIGSMLRWDRNKRRASLSLEAPLNGNPKWGVLFALDGRQENWTDPSKDFAGDFRMRKVQMTAEIRSVTNGRLSWSSGFAVSSRRFSNALQSGLGLKYMGSVRRALLKAPEKRLKLDSSAAFEAGKLFSSGTPRFVKLNGTVSMSWRQVTSGIRMGRIFGDAPFDERFVIGLDRDSDLWLRGHSATIDGRKSAANAGRAFLITNSDFQQKVADTGWLRLTAGPFLDTGKSALSSRWIADSGVEARFSILGAVTMSLSYGKSAFFISPR